MSRVRVSTTVDGDLLQEARRRRPGSDSVLLDEALAALLSRHRGAAIDQAYNAAYAEHPLDEPDEWGDLASFREAAGAS